MENNVTIPLNAMAPFVYSLILMLFTDTPFNLIALPLPLTILINPFPFIAVVLLQLAMLTLFNESEYAFPLVVSTITEKLPCDSTFVNSESVKFNTRGSTQPLDVTRTPKF
jgi:hypothetical protein